MKIFRLEFTDAQGNPYSEEITVRNRTHASSEGRKIAKEKGYRFIISIDTKKPAKELPAQSVQKPEIELLPVESDKKFTTTIYPKPETDYQVNRAIEKLIDEKGINPDSYTSDEKIFLRRYSGYGGIQSEELTTEQIKGSFTEFYTPDAIIRKMWALAYKYGFKNEGTVLEPSVGTGQFLKYVPQESPATGYEVSKYSYSICKIIYPQFNFYHQTFEELFIKDRDSVKHKTDTLPKFDLVIGNPPYGDVGGIFMGMGEKQYTRAHNYIEYFILRGLDLCKPDGLLIYIIGTEVANGGIPFLQQGTTKTKQMIADRAELLDAYRLPNGVFDRTDVLSDIIVLKRK